MLDPGIRTVPAPACPGVGPAPSVRSPLLRGLPSTATIGVSNRTLEREPEPVGGVQVVGCRRVSIAVSQPASAATRNNRRPVIPSRIPSRGGVSRVRPRTRMTVEVGASSTAPSLLDEDHVIGVVGLRVPIGGHVDRVRQRLRADQQPGLGGHRAPSKPRSSASTLMPTRRCSAMAGGKRRSDHEAGRRAAGLDPSGRDQAQHHLAVTRASRPAPRRWRAASRPDPAARDRPSEPRPAAGRSAPPGHGPRRPTASVASKTPSPRSTPRSSGRSSGNVGGTRTPSRVAISLKSSGVSEGSPRWSMGCARHGRQPSYEAP